MLQAKGGELQKENISNSPAKTHFTGPQAQQIRADQGHRHLLR